MTAQHFFKRPSSVSFCFFQRGTFCSNHSKAYAAFAWPLSDCCRVLQMKPSSPKSQEIPQTLSHQPSAPACSSIRYFGRAKRRACKASCKAVYCLSCRYSNPHVSTRFRQTNGDPLFFRRRKSGDKADHRKNHRLHCVKPKSKAV